MSDEGGVDVMRASLRHVGALSFEARSDSGHCVVMAASPELGGDNAGPRPMEMVLMGLGGCSGIDVGLILRKARQAVSDIRIELSAERAEGVPAVFTRIHLRYVVSGDGLSSGVVERAVGLSVDKYCSVARMLEGGVSITHSVDVVGGQG